MSIPVKENKEKEEIKEEENIEIVEEEQGKEIENTTKEKNTLAEEYLNLARVIQADFDNYRKRSLDQIEKARIDAIAETVEIILPSLDAFKKAKENIKDETTLQGINMLEKAFNSSLNKLGVQKIEAIGKQLDPNYHNVLAVAKDETKEDGIVLDEVQAGYVMNNKVIRCSQVLVNKLD